MPWVNDIYFYSVRTLKVIAANYNTIYEGLPLSLSFEVVNPFNLAEYKVDFDQALSAIGRGKWEGITSDKISGYKGFGRLQKLIIAEVLGVLDEELRGLGFENPARLRGYAYYLMAKYLNPENRIGGT